MVRRDDGRYTVVGIVSWGEIYAIFDTQQMHVASTGALVNV